MEETKNAGRETHVSAGVVSKFDAYPLTTGTWAGQKPAFFLLDKIVTKPVDLLIQRSGFLGWRQQQQQ